MVRILRILKLFKYPLHPALQFEGTKWIEMLFVVICMHWKYNWIITTFKLIIFYCLTTFYNIMFLKYFSFWFTFDHFSKWLMTDILYEHGGYAEEYSWRLIRLICIFHNSIILASMLKENPIHWIFRFFSYSCLGKLIQINLN